MERIDGYASWSRFSLDELRLEMKKDYTNVALDPNKGYHFHTGRRLANLLGCDDWIILGDCIEFGCDFQPRMSRLNCRRSRG